MNAEKKTQGNQGEGLSILIRPPLWLRIQEQIMVIRIQPAEDVRHLVVPMDGVVHL